MSTQGEKYHLLYSPYGQWYYAVYFHLIAKGTESHNNQLAQVHIAMMWQSQAFKLGNLSMCSSSPCYEDFHVFDNTLHKLVLLPCRIHVANFWMLEMWFSLVEKNLRQSNSLWRTTMSYGVPVRLLILPLNKKDVIYLSYSSTKIFSISSCLLGVVCSKHLDD